MKKQVDLKKAAITLVAKVKYMWFNIFHTDWQ